MHYHLEIVMPPTDNVEAAVKQVLETYREDYADEYGDKNKYAFYDWYVIGGRFSGSKIFAKYTSEAIQEFNKALQNMGVTVSGVQFGKQELSPASQIPVVDEMWRKHFPDGGQICPLFKHFNDQYQGSKGYPDIMSLKETSASTKAARVMFVAPDDDKLQVRFMVEDSVWNGVNYIDTEWDGTLAEAIDMFKRKWGHWNPEYVEQIKPKEDWLVVTVDYHS